MKFEGVINGKKFDDVADYNKEMERLIRAGVSVNASSKTVSVDDAEPAPEQAEIAKEDLVLYPGFDSSTHYIDEIVEGNDEDANRAAHCLEYINQCSDDVVKNVDKFSTKECQEILTNVREILDTINEDSEENKKVADKLDETKTIITNAQVAIDMYKKFYTDMENFFVKEIHKRGEEIEQPSKLAKPARRNPIMELLEAIFGE